MKKKAHSELQNLLISCFAHIYAPQSTHPLSHHSFPYIASYSDQH
ncbi:hypothetical protein SAMN05216577_1661 [Pseudomonas citronellolis]|uniref:Uncharacterized protein n=1 Tax=Pseudomonas citronellolis TaxID=53408 RepID=A0AAQ1KQ98_9PSED|nr:hypothetical protein SAMN05216577_1661 [Pseudomonas citronellolis]